jgi:hypothetical protein
VRRLPALLCGVLAFGVVQVAASPATAGPVPELCTYDAARGGVPAGFVLDACVDAGALTLRNDLHYPVTVRRSGDVSEPLIVHADDSAAAAVLRLIADADTLLMPGDVVRWPLGAAAAELTVGSLPTGAEPAIVGSVASFLPLPADESADEFSAAFAQIIGEVAAGVDVRADCVAGKNFLRVAACDVVTSSTIGRVVFAALPRSTARDVHPLLDDPRNWADWHATATAYAQVLAGRELRLIQTALPVPPPPPGSDPASVRPSGAGSVLVSGSPRGTAVGGVPPVAAAGPAAAPPAPVAPAPAPAAPPQPVPAQPAPAKPAPAPAPPKAEPPPAPPRDDDRDHHRDDDRDDDRGNGKGNNGHGKGNGGRGNR